MDSKTNSGGASFEFEGRAVYTIGRRERHGALKGLLIFAAICLIVPAILVVTAVIAEDMSMIALGFEIYAGIMLIVFFSILPRLICDRIKYPSIGLREDGVFMIFKSNRRAVCLTDKITGVNAKRHISVSVSTTTSRSGDTVYRTTRTSTTVHNWGKVIFYLKDPVGRTYKKTARYVSECFDVESNIRGMLKGRG